MLRIYPIPIISDHKGNKEIINKKRGEEERELTGNLSHALGSVPCEWRVPQPPRAYEVHRKVREDSTIIVI
jgi:hypothetical protein